MSIIHDFSDVITCPVAPQSPVGQVVGPTVRRGGLALCVVIGGLNRGQMQRETRGFQRLTSGPMLGATTCGSGGNKRRGTGMIHP